MFLFRSRRWQRRFLRVEVEAEKKNPHIIIKANKKQNIFKCIVNEVSVQPKSKTEIIPGLEILVGYSCLHSSMHRCGSHITGKMCLRYLTSVCISK